jgi:integrase
MQSAVANHMSSLTKVRIDRITTDKVRAILNDYLESQAEDTKRRHTHTKGGANALLFRLSSLMAFAVREGYLRRKPYTLIRFKKQRKPRAVVRVNQTVPFMDAVDNNSTSPDQVLAVALMIGLGLRESEALGIRWEYINLEQKEVTIGRLVDGQFETKGGEARKLTLPTWLTKRIRDRWKADGKPDDGLVLPGPAYDVAHSQGFTKKLVEKAGRAIKIRGLTPHRLRASFISQMVLEAIRPIAEVQLMVGHKHYQTTMGYVEGFNQNRNAQVVLEELQGFKRVPKKEKQPQKKSTKSPKIKTKK